MMRWHRGPRGLGAERTSSRGAQDDPGHKQQRNEKRSLTRVQRAHRTMNGRWARNFVATTVM
jgi:hypothetical protein